MRWAFLGITTKKLGRGLYFREGLYFSKVPFREGVFEEGYISGGIYLRVYGSNKFKLEIKLAYNNFVYTNHF